MDLKIAVLGPCKSGKTLMCMALANQTIVPCDYEPTVALRCAGAGLPPHVPLRPATMAAPVVRAAVGAPARFAYPKRLALLHPCNDA